jgi:hypothetical protein
MGEVPMSGKLRVVLLIIAGIGVGTAALIFGLLMLFLDTGPYHGEPAMIAACGAGILAASSAGFAALVLGGLQHLDERDDRDF